MYVCCGRKFFSWNAWDQHTENAASHRTCNICNVVFGSVERFDKHWEKKHVVKAPKLVDCSFCSRRFKSPSAYAQHIESGIHRVSRHQVTRAVQMLRVVPQITLAPPLQLRPTTTSRIEPLYEYAPETSAFDGFGHAPGEDSDQSGDEDGVDAEVQNEPESEGPVPGPPLGPREEAASTITLEPARATPAPATTFSVAPAQRLTRRPPPTWNNNVDDGMPTYVPADFANQGIPYACPICLKTFRNVFSLTSHMNSPVHDPAAFMCPKCDKHFGLVSALIQHLESGCCKLASPREIYDRFAKLTQRFSRMLTI